MKLADGKAAGVVTAVGLLVGVAGATAKPLLVAARGASPALLLLVILTETILLVSAVASTWYCFGVMLPRTPPAGGALCSFPDVADLSPSVYVEAVALLDSPAQAANISRHNWVLAEICRRKFRAARRAFGALYIALSATYALALEYGLALLLGLGAA